MNAFFHVNFRNSYPQPKKRTCIHVQRIQIIIIVHHTMLVNSPCKSLIGLAIWEIIHHSYISLWPLQVISQSQQSWQKDAGGWVIRTTVKLFYWTWYSPIYRVNSIALSFPILKQSTDDRPYSIESVSIIISFMQMMPWCTEEHAL